MDESGSVAVVFCCRLYHVSSSINPRYTYKSLPTKNIWTRHMRTRFTSCSFTEVHRSVSSSFSRHKPSGPEPLVSSGKVLTHQRRTAISESLCTGFSLVVVKFPICFEEDTGHSFCQSNQLLFWRVFQVSGKTVALHRKMVATAQDSQTSQYSLMKLHMLRVHSDFISHGTWKTALSFVIFPFGPVETLQADDSSKDLCFFSPSGQSVP